VQAIDLRPPTLVRPDKQKEKAKIAGKNEPSVFAEGHEISLAGSSSKIHQQRREPARWGQKLTIKAKNGGNQSLSTPFQATQGAKKKLEGIAGAGRGEVKTKCFPSLHETGKTAGPIEGRIPAPAEDSYARLLRAKIGV